MLKFKALFIIALIMVGVYLVLPKDKKQTLWGKLRELGRAFLIALAIHWVIMLVVYLYQKFLG